MEAGELEVRESGFSPYIAGMLAMLGIVCITLVFGTLCYKISALEVRADTAEGELEAAGYWMDTHAERIRDVEDFLGDYHKGDAKLTDYVGDYGPWGDSVPAPTAESYDPIRVPAPVPSILEPFLR